jgi:hypothetical protein
LEITRDFAPFVTLKLKVPVKKYSKMVWGRKKGVSEIRRSNLTNFEDRRAPKPDAIASDAKQARVTAYGTYVIRYYF